MRLLFEDSENAAISQLLLCAQPETLFSGGNKKLLQYLNKVQDEKIIVYVDVVPDNRDTIEQYKKLEELIKLAEQENNLFLIPIPCIEYYVIKAFCSKEYIDIQSVLQISNYKQIMLSNRGRKLKLNSFEKYCKSVLRNYQECFKNETFYNVDCLCSKVDDYNLSCKEKERLEKAWVLISKLPAFPNNDKNIYFETRTVNISKLRQEFIAKYNYLAKQFEENGYIKHATLL